MSSTIFTGGLAYNITESHLKSYFSQFGKIRKAEIARHKSGLSKGYGFIFFADSSGVPNTLKVDHHEIIGRKIDVQKAKERPQKEAYKQLMKKCRVFVGGLAPDTTDREFKTAFFPFGEVKSAYIIKDHHEQKSLGFGYVLFKDPKVSQSLFEMKTLLIKGTLVTLSPYKFKDSKKRFEGSKKKNSDREKQGCIQNKFTNEESREQDQAQRQTPTKVIYEGMHDRRSGEVSSKSVSEGMSKKGGKLKEVIAALPEGIHRNMGKRVSQNGSFDPKFLRIFSLEECERKEAYGEINLRFNIGGRLRGEKVSGGWTPFGSLDNH